MKVCTTPDGTFYDADTGEVLNLADLPHGTEILAGARPYEILDMAGARRAAGYLAAAEVRLKEDTRHTEAELERLRARLVELERSIDEHPAKRRAEFYKTALASFAAEHPDKAFAGLGKAKTFKVEVAEGTVEVGATKVPRHLEVAGVTKEAKEESLSKLLAWATVQEEYEAGLHPTAAPVGLVRRYDPEPDIQTIKRYIGRRIAENPNAKNAPPGMEWVAETQRGHAEFKPPKGGTQP